MARSTRELRTFLASRALSVLGLQLMASALVFRVLELGDGPLGLGKLGLAATLSSLAASLPLGQLVDHLEKRWAILVSHALLAALAAVIAAVGQMSFGALVVAAALIAVLRNFRSISQFTVFGELLREQAEPGRWVNLSTLSWQLAAFGGPILAGFVGGSSRCFSLATALFLAAFCCQLVIVRVLEPRKAPAARATLKQLRNFFLSNEKLHWALLLDFVVVFFAGATALLPFLHANRGTAFDVGLLRSAMPCGVILGTVFVLRKPLTRNWAGWLFFATSGFGTSWLLLSLSTAFNLSYLLLVGAGLFDALSLSVREVLLQQETPAALKGRVYSLNNFLVNASDELSEWESGLAAHYFGVAASLRIGGGLTLLASAIFAHRRVLLPKASAVPAKSARITL